MVIIVMPCHYLFVSSINTYWEHNKVKPFWNALGPHQEHGGNKLITRCEHNENLMGTLWEHRNLKNPNLLPYDEP